MAVEQLAVVAVTKVDQEVGLQAAVGKKLRIDLGQVHTTHRAAIEPQGARGHHEVAASERAVARGRGFGEGLVALEVFLGARLVPDLRHVFIKLRVVGHDHGDRKSKRLNPVTNAHLVCRLLLEKQKNKTQTQVQHINNQKHKV